MSVLVYGTILVLLSSPLVVISNSVLNRVEVIRHAGSSPSADAFSNPGCLSKDCVDGTHCYSEECCKCQCPNSKANYIVNKWMCVSRDQLNQMDSTKCKYSIRKPNEPLLGLPLTEAMVEKVAFTRTADHETLIPCNQSVQVSWSYRDLFGDWKDGPGNIFSVEGFIKNREIRDQRVMKNLTWTGKLSPYYAGMFIKFIFKCEGEVQGCALAKITGEHAYDTTRPSQVKTTATTTTTTTTTKSLNPTTESYENNTNAYQKNNKQPGSGTGGNASAIFGPILGVLGLICIIGVVCVVVVKYRRKKRHQDNETNSVAKLEEYQDPIYAHINNGDFDNPVYCDPTLDPAYIRAQLGPLPRIPGSASPYEPLNSMTRNTPDYDNPVDGVKPGVDYDNPPVGMQNTSDYDNPPVTGGKESNEDYDNPPVTGGMGNTGDYDNPPVKSAEEINQDYDNPPSKTKYDTPPIDNAPSDTAEDTFF